jgi:hypothetical protein
MVSWHAISDWARRRPRRLRHILTSSVAHHKSPASADLSVEEDGAVLHNTEHHHCTAHFISQEAT